MATKLKMAGMHTAGIFSDMTVDGPVIGTLVVIVDRAKNLPNRKTIGKQDPYCAARLGKEAKKTETDKRGGQTPRWDQELRFTVHDSPDYYQLKVSVFNDDKRTDLIGETWVNLQDVIVAGGGQSDVWHNLNFKGKYAGEIRVEITYYDKRPKPEKPEKKEPKQNPSTITPSTSVQSITEFGSVSGGASGSGSLREGVGGPRQLGVKPVVKRRPLPTDPITGAPAQPPVAAAAPIPVAAPPAELVHTPPRGYQAPSAVDHMQMTPTRGYRDSPSAIPDHVQTPPRGYQNVPTGIPDHIQTQGYKMSPNGMPDHVPRGYANPPVIQDQPSPRGYPSSDAMQAQRGYHSPIVGQEHAQTPPRGYQNGFVQDQSPGQRVEYNAPSTRYNQPQGYDISPGSTPYGAPQDMMAGAPPSSQPMRNNDRYDYEHGHDMNQYAAPEADPRDRYGGSRMLTYEPQQPGPYELPMSPGPPPPPPAHASRHVSSVPTLAQPKAVHGRPVSRGNSNPYNTSVDDLHRHSMPAYAQPTSAYQAYNPPKNDDQFRRPGNGNPYPLRKNSYDSRDLRYNSSYEDMQPTVEDAPPTPAPGPGPNSYQTIIPHRGSAPSAMQHPAEGMYDQVPAPLNLRHRPSRNSIATTAPSHQHSISSGGYPTSSSMSSVRDGASVTSRNSYGQLPASRQDRSQSVGVQNTNGDYGLPEMPPTLVPGMDPIIAKEISDRIYNEKRASYSQNPASSQRGRYQEVPRHQPQQIQQPIPLPYHDNSAVVPYSPQAAYDDRQNRYAASTAMVPVKPRGTSPNPAMDRRGNSPNPMDRRGVSPNPMDRRGASPNPPMDRRGASPHPPMDRRGVSPNPMTRRGTSPNPAVTRKPVSPASEPRRLSGVAFGPDSYDVFNPSLAGSKSATSLSAAYDSKDDPDAKIITYDGREIDPSDHIPESNYAPLLEQKGPKYASQMPDRNYRAPPAEHPMPSNGRKQLRQAARPQSMAVSSPIYFSGGIPDNPPATAHRKLQKKSNRMSAQPAYHSSPNVPIYREPTYASSRTSMQRPSTAEYSNDGYQSNGYQYGSSPGGGYRGAVGPVVPAKIPMALPAPVSSGAGRGGGDGKSGHVVGPSVETLDIRDQSRRGRGAECGRSFLHVSKEQLVKMKQVMVKFAKFVGPGFMVAVAYIDPGNYATDVAAGATYRFKLLFIVLMSNIFAIFLQSLCIKLGTVSGLNLAEACRAFLPKWMNYALYILAEGAIIATDIAEVIGTAIAINLLIPQIPLVAGCALSILDVLILLIFYPGNGEMKRLRYFEIFVAALVLGVVVCFCIQLSLIKDTSVGEVFKGYLPSKAIVEQKGLYQACGILGATVMPHSLYLGSGIVQPRLLDYDKQNNIVKKDFDLGTKETYYPSLPAIKFCLKYSYAELAICLFTFALFVNSAILIVAGSALYNNPAAPEADLFGIYDLLVSSISKGAGTIFALALLLSGTSAGIVCTIAGQMVSEGALNWTIRPWLRRLVTRSLSITPSIIIAGAVGREGLSAALNASQVALSIVLPFVTAPLIYFTCRNKYMTVRCQGRPNAFGNDDENARGNGDATMESESVYEHEGAGLGVDMGEGTKMRNHWITAAVAGVIWTIMAAMNVANLVLLGKGDGV